MSRRPFEFNNIPLGYLLTFRGHGTWLHGDARGSVDRFHNRYGSPLLPTNLEWEKHNRKELKHPPVKLSAPQRAAVEEAIRETCNSQMVLVDDERENKPHSHGGYSPV